jgi:uncharacterized protein YqjF (DUF2071 family)
MTMPAGPSRVYNDAVDALAELEHRPWPLPPGPWRWRQRWLELLFAHWPVSGDTLRPLVPPELEIDTFEGRSWLGVVPFRMEGIMRRPLPDLPWISAFPELNLRLYVTHGGKPGVWFLSLDAGNPLAVWAAQRFFHLPYVRARFELRRDGDTLDYRSERLAAPAGLRFEARYRPSGQPYRSAPGSLEHFLTERYCLYARSPRGRLYRAEIHHRPWPLQPAEAEFAVNELGDPHGLRFEGPPLLHFSQRLDVVVWGLEAIA